jgi:glycosyltransferase involved in cell wall biosynthesis
LLTNPSPTVSVILTCYNLGQYLDEAVDSVLAQTFQDFEIVIVNDGSTDPHTLERLACERPKTRVVHIENRGLPGARNEGIRQSAGRYICSLDADDRLAPAYMEKSVAVLDQNPSVGFVSHWLRAFGEEEWEWKPDSAAFPALLDRNSINGAAMVRRTALAAVGFYDESMRSGLEDWDVWIGLIEKAFVGVIIPEVLFFYRRRAGSMSRLMLEGDAHERIYGYIVDKHRSSFESHLVDLLVRRENEKRSVLREAHDLELDCNEVFSADVHRLRDTLRVAQRRHQHERAEQAATTDLMRVTAERDEYLERLQQVSAERAEAQGVHEQSLAIHAEELGRATHREAQLERVIEGQNAELRRLSSAAAELDAAVTALRGSLSWRLTRPLRAVYSLFKG